MAKTLADMTIKERADCVGMWAEHAHPHYDGLEVIIDSDHDSVTTISTKSGQQYIVVGEVMRHITPRFDLPRAWTSKGEPFPRPALPKRSRDRKPINASEVQGILGTDWLDGKTPEELVREHREGME